MKLVDTEETVVLVTGSSLDARRSATGRSPTGSSPRSTGAARVTPIAGRSSSADAWYLEQPDLPPEPHDRHRRTGRERRGRRSSPAFLPTVYNREEQVFVQADFEGELKRAALWGANAAGHRGGGRGVHDAGTAGRSCWGGSGGSGRGVV